MEGYEEEDEYYFSYSATLRIFGNISDFDEISKIVGVEPTKFHRKGDIRTPNSKPREFDMWSYEPNISESEPLSNHLRALWAAIGANSEQIKELKNTLKVDVFCGYRSNCETAGFEVSHQALVIFQELEIPFGVSVIVI